MNEVKNSNNHQQLWKGIAWIAGGFSLLISILLIANYIQMNRYDPVSSQTIEKLVERLNQNPGDEQLREEIRTLDLLARKAFFTTQWQIRMGGYLLLIGTILLIIALQMLTSGVKNFPVLSQQSDQNLLNTQRLARRWVAVFSTILVLSALTFAFLSHRQLENKFKIREIATVNETTENNAAEKEISGDVQNSVENEKPDDNEAKIVSENGDKLTGKQAGIVEEKTGKIPENQTNSKEKESPLPPVVDKGDVFTAFRGPGSNGITVQKNVPVDWDGKTGKNIRWKTKIPLPGFNSPIIWGNKVFLSGGNNTKREVYCFDANSGEIVWTGKVENVPGSPATAPSVPDYTGYAAPTMTTDGENVFAIFANGDIAAFSMEGKPVWSKNLGVPDNHYGYASSLQMFENTVIVQYDQRKSAKVLALSARTGETVWETSRDVKISWASPVIVDIGDHHELILAADPFVISYNPAIGKEIWRLKCLSGEVGPSVAYADGMVFALNEYASLVAIKIEDKPEKVWDDTEYLSDVPSPVATADYLFVATSYGMVACYDTKTGTKYWEQEFDNSIYSSPLISEEKVYLVDKTGITHIFKADKEFALISQPALGEKTTCTPAFANGRIYLRGENNLYCVE